MDFETATLKAGTILYHGTSAEFEDLEGPSWVSRSVSVADFFKGRYKGPQPRVLVFETTESLNLILIRTPREFAEVLLEAGHTGDEDMTEIAELFAARFAGEYDGWIIPDNYPDGDDILLIAPDDVLERIGELKREDR